MNISKFLLYFLLSIFNKKKRYVILTPNLLYFFIKKVFIFDKKLKSIFFQQIERNSDYITVQEIFFNNDYNLKKFNFLENKNDNNKKKKLIIDCGANIGCSSLFLYKDHPKSFIVAIEPEKKNFALLQTNTKSIENLRLINSAISSEEHFFSLEKSNDSRAHKIIDENYEKCDCSIKTLTINNILKEYSENKFDFFLIKIDIEGFEKKLFEKNTEWVDNFKVIIIELHDWMMPFNNQSLNFQKKILNSKRHKDIIVSGENLILINY
jgi:FkbM family methyltransferase